MGLSQRRIHCTESPNSTLSPLRQTAGDRKGQREQRSMTNRETRGGWDGILINTEMNKEIKPG